MSGLKHSVMSNTTFFRKSRFFKSPPLKFEHHMAFAKANGVSAKEMGALLTHVAFYAGWPNAWAAFRVAKSVYGD